jgi:hypothetical protein
LLGIELLEDRSTPAIIFSPNGVGGGVFAPFGNFTGPIHVASGDVNGDGFPDIIVAQGQGPGSGSEIRIFDGKSARLQSQAVVIADFFAYPGAGGTNQTPGFAGDVFVAAADFNGDGFAELVTTPGFGGNGHVKVFDFHPGNGAFLGSNPIERTSFFAYPGFQGSVRVATLNLGFGLAPVIVTVSGAGASAADVRAYANPFAIGSVAPGVFVQPAAQTFVFPGFLGGVSLAAGNVTTTGTQLFVSPDIGNPLITTFILAHTTTGRLVFVPGTTFSTGFIAPTDQRIGTADVNGDGQLEVLAASAGSGNPSISVFSLNNGFATQLSPLTFQGFGFFGGTWVSASTFTGAPTNTTSTSGVSLFTGTTGLTGFGTTGMTGFGSTGLAGFGSTGLTGFGTGLTGFGSTGSTGFGPTTGFGTTGSTGAGVTPATTLTSGVPTTSSSMTPFGAGLTF